MADKYLGHRLLAASRLARYERTIEKACNRALARRKAAVLSHVGLTAAVLAEPATLTAAGDFDSEFDTDVDDEVEPVVQDMMDELVASVVGRFPLDAAATARVFGQIDVASQVATFIRLVKGIGPYTATRINEALALGVGMGESIPQLTERVESVFAMAERRSALIARTETARAANSSSHEAATAVNAELPLTRSWLASSDERVRETHSQAEEDNQDIPFDQPYSVGGYEAEFPGDPNLPPEESISCRCVETFSDGSEQASNAE